MVSAMLLTAIFMSQDVLMSGSCEAIDSRIEAVYQTLQKLPTTNFDDYLYDDAHREVKQFREECEKRPFKCTLRFASVQLQRSNT